MRLCHAIWLYHTTHKDRLHGAVSRKTPCYRAQTIGYIGLCHTDKAAYMRLCHAQGWLHRAV
eukprot:1227927-Amorphochlora_amoeboformis.AAC.1